jgi:hypothetical protein
MLHVSVLCYSDTIIDLHPKKIAHMKATLMIDKYRINFKSF